MTPVGELLPTLSFLVSEHLGVATLSLRLLHTQVDLEVPRTEPGQADHDVKTRTSQSIHFNLLRRPHHHRTSAKMDIKPVKNDYQYCENLDSAEKNALDHTNVEDKGFAALYAVNANECFITCPAKHQDIQGRPRLLIDRLSGAMLNGLSSVAQPGRAPYE